MLILLPNVAHYQFVIEVQSTRISRMSIIHQQLSTDFENLLSSFERLGITYENVRQSTLANSLQFMLKILTKCANISQLSSCISRLLLETKWHQFRKWSAVNRKLSYAHRSDDNRTLSFRFSGLWLVPKTLYCYLRFWACMMATYLLRACAVATIIT